MVVRLKEVFKIETSRFVFAFLFWLVVVGYPKCLFCFWIVYYLDFFCWQDANQSWQAGLALVWPRENARLETPLNWR